MTGKYIIIQPQNTSKSRLSKQQNRLLLSAHPADLSAVPAAILAPTSETIFQTSLISSGTSAAAHSFANSTQRPCRAEAASRSSSMPKVL